MNTDAELLEKFKTWFKKTKPTEFETFSKMIKVEGGKYLVINTKELSDTDQMLLSNTISLYLSENSE